MTKPFFVQQVARLKNRFGEKALGTEFVAILWNILDDLTEEEFRQIVSNMIGSRKHTNPPLEVDFREASLAIKKRAFEADVQGATRQMYGGRTPGERRENLRQVMQKHFKVDTIAEALELERMKIRLARANGEPDPVIDFTRGHDVPIGNPLAKRKRERSMNNDLTPASELVDGMLKHLVKRL